MFPSPGTDHTYPNRATVLRGCATSGLPVTYTFASDEDRGSCVLGTRDGKPTVTLKDANVGDCRITATQQGDATWAAAGPVVGNFAVGVQPVTISWADPSRSLRYSGNAWVRIKIVSPDPFRGGMLRMTATGDCGVGPQAEQEKIFYVNGESVLSIPVVTKKAGSCTLGGALTSDHSNSTFLDSRTYRVNNA
ncbi:hypothetical protein ACFYRC_36790 [Streptomyces sp. NPDC005279]|uniref:hypothetical protein n=1 Tax=Streptomyces sp. NPDC005279 TaxID=3364712 RepID=UPI0036C0C09B